MKDLAVFRKKTVLFCSFLEIGSVNHFPKTFTPNPTTSRVLRTAFLTFSPSVPDKMQSEIEILLSVNLNGKIIFKSGDNLDLSVVHCPENLKYTRIMYL